MKQLTICTLLLAGLFVAGTSALEAQSVMAGDELFIEMLKVDVRQARTDVMTSVMEFSSEDAAIFWPIYDDYRKKAEALADKDLAQVNEYAGAYWSLTNPQAKDMAKGFFDINREQFSLLEDLYNKLAVALTPVQALKACQLEHRLDLIIEMQIVNELPMIE